MRHSCDNHIFGDHELWQLQHMNAFDFVTKDELDELPEDPRQAFVEFVRIARERLHQTVDRLDPDNFGRIIEDA